MIGIAVYATISILQHFADLHGSFIKGDGILDLLLSSELKLRGHFLIIMDDLT